MREYSKRDTPVLTSRVRLPHHPFIGRTQTVAWLQAGGRISAQLDDAGALEVLYDCTAKSWVPTGRSTATGAADVAEVDPWADFAE